MNTIQIGVYYIDQQEQVVEVIAVQEMTEEEFTIKETEIALFDDGGSHSLHKYSDELVIGLIEEGAIGIEKLD